MKGDGVLEGGQGSQGSGVSESSWRGLEGSQSIGGRAFGHLGMSNYTEGHLYIWRAYKHTRAYGYLLSLNKQAS